MFFSCPFKIFVPLPYGCRNPGRKTVKRCHVQHIRPCLCQHITPDSIFPHRQHFTDRTRSLIDFPDLMIGRIFNSINLIRSKNAALSSFPYSLYFKTVRSVITEYGEELLYRSPNEGCAILRNSIASYLLRYRGFFAQPEQIIIGSFLTAASCTASDGADTYLMFSPLACTAASPRFPQAA